MAKGKGKSKEKEKQYEIERIVNWCLVQDKGRVPEWHVLYEVKWLNWDAKFNTWEPLESFPAGPPIIPARQIVLLMRKDPSIKESPVELEAKAAKRNGQVVPKRETAKGAVKGAKRASAASPRVAATPRAPPKPRAQPKATSSSAKLSAPSRTRRSSTTAADVAKSAAPNEPPGREKLEEPELGSDDVIFGFAEDDDEDDEQPPLVPGVFQPPALEARVAAPAFVEDADGNDFGFVEPDLDAVDVAPVLLTGALAPPAVAHETVAGDGNQHSMEPSAPEPEAFYVAEDLDPVDLAESTSAAIGQRAGRLPRKRKAVRFSATVRTLIFDSPSDEPTRKRAKILLRAPAPPRSPHKPPPAPALHRTGLFGAGLFLKANMNRRNPAHISPTSDSDLITATSSANFFAPPPPSSKSRVAGPTRHSRVPVLTHHSLCSSSPSPESSPPRETAPLRQISSPDTTSRTNKHSIDAVSEVDGLHQPRPSTPTKYITATGPGPSKLAAHARLLVASAAAGPSCVMLPDL